MPLFHPARASIRGPVRTAAGGGAFTLVEILTVMGILVVLLVVVTPVVVGRSRSADLSRTVYLFSGALERARADAMARNAYRYVALEPATVSGNPGLLVKTLGCRNGVRFPAADASAPSLIAATIKLNQVQITVFTDDKPARAYADRKLAIQGSGDSREFTARLTVAGLFGNAFLFECAPGGGVTLVEDTANTRHTLCHWIETGLQPLRGGSAGDAANYAVVQVAGLTGQTQVYRP